MKESKMQYPRKVCTCVLVSALILLAVLCGASAIPALRDMIVPVYYRLFPRECTVTDGTVAINNSIYNTANHLQNKASVWMGTWDGKLYFSPRWCAEDKYRNEYYHYLACFEERTVSLLFRVQDNIMGISNDYIYYSDWYDTNSGTVREKIYCYDLRHDTNQLVCETDFLTTEHYFANDNSLYLSFNAPKGPYYLINGACVREDALPPQSYVLNGKSYSVRGKGDSNCIVVTDQKGNQIELKYDTPLGRQSLIPCKLGLLIHNEGEGNALYLIPKNSEEIVPLFEVPCTSAVSAVNVYDDYAYLSISRYYYDENHDSTVPFENDQLAGTYKIDLTNYTVEKILDTVYNGIYIFDDAGIYACTEKLEIHKFDFGGKNVIQLLGYE